MKTTPNTTGKKQIEVIHGGGRAHPRFKLPNGTHAETQRRGEAEGKAEGSPEMHRPPLVPGAAASEVRGQRSEVRAEAVAAAAVGAAVATEEAGRMPAPQVAEGSGAVAEGKKAQAEKPRTKN